MRWRPHLGPESRQSGAGRESSWPTQSPFSLSLSLFGDENARAKDSLQVQRAPLPLERLPNSTGLTWELGESHQSATAPHTANANGHHHNHPVQIQIQEIQKNKRKNTNQIQTLYPTAALNAKGSFHLKNAFVVNLGHQGW